MSGQQNGRSSRGVKSGTGLINCLECGMRIDVTVKRCPKCDGILNEQTPGQFIKADIAHHGERVEQALTKLNSLLAEADAERAQGIHLIVGGGLIREAVLARLNGLQKAREIRTYKLQSGNTGAIRIILRDY